MLLKMNPRNIVKLLSHSFGRPEDGVETAITAEERLFASQLEGLIKDAIDDQIFLETYTTLNFSDENVEPVAIEGDEEDLGREFEVTNNNKRPSTSIEVDFAYKKKAVEYWCSGKNECTREINVGA
ncbi:neutral zinc metallopeptidase [Lasius niger]|uniref:Neutral zinc metallopeptidase n=1 Tax=Lasius niger TaxID=67767 RepID=A0A0J7JUM3_LASNI|nr:neutral zinc metallopeptidase [Lasius niger]